MARSGGKILVVDDEKDIVESLDAFLSGHGYQILPAFDGKAGVEKTKTDMPDLVIMDLGMTPMTGFEACRQIRVDHKTKKIPILVLTAAGMAFDKIQRALASGADAYLDKPFDNELLLTKIQNLLSGTDPSQKIKRRRAAARA